MSQEPETGAKAYMTDAWQQLATQTLAVQNAWLKGFEGFTATLDQSRFESL